MSRMTEFKYWHIARPKEKIECWIAWHLPLKVVMWAYYRVLAHATTDKYGTTVVPEITAMDAIDRFMKDNKL